MIIKILSILLISLGITDLYLSIKNHDKNLTDKYKRMKFYLDIIMCIFFTITGLLLLFEVISGAYISFVVLIYVIINIIINRKINYK